MVSTIIVHVIGIAALSSVLVAVIIYTSMVTNVMIYDNIKRILEETANSLVLQIRYAINAKTNLTLNLEYPVLIGNNRAYNVYIGTGYQLHAKFPWTSIPEDNNIYVFLIEPRSRVYVYEMVCPRYYIGYNISLSEDPTLFGSTIVTSLRIGVINNTILISIEKGEVVLH